MAEAQAVRAHGIVTPGGDSFASRRDELTRAIGELESYIAEATKELKGWRKELLAINAALEIMNASEDDGTELADTITLDATIRTAQRRRSRKSHRIR